jgi:hypothetical protein
MAEELELSPEEQYRCDCKDVAEPRYEMVRYKNLYSLEKYYPTISHLTFPSVFMQLYKEEAGKSLVVVVLSI